MVLAGASSSAKAGVEIVEIERVQVVNAVSGVVHDPSGAPILGATVAEVSPDWKTVIQSTNTDADGRFSIVPKAKKRIYHLMISSNGFNPLVVHVRVSQWTKKLLDLRPEI